MVVSPALILGDYSNRKAEAGIPLDSPLVYFVEIVDVKSKDLLDTIETTIKDKSASAAVEEYTALKETGFADTRVSEWETNNIGYDFLNENELSGAIEAFQSNVEAYPSSPNAYDSLADAYVKAGDKQKAIAYYEKAVALDPIFIMSLEKLKTLGVPPPAGFVEANSTRANVVATDTRMSLYTYLARLSYETFEVGDNARAVEIAEILEQTWDRKEELKTGRDGSLEKTNATLFRQIDRGMDQYIGPIKGYTKNPPDRTAVRAAYDHYLQQLKLAD